MKWELLKDIAQSILIAVATYLAGGILTIAGMMRFLSEFSSDTEITLWTAVPTLIICLVATLTGALTGRRRLLAVLLPGSLIIAACAVLAVVQPVTRDFALASLAAGTAGLASGWWITSRLLPTQSQDGYSR